jgi:hypothetical protein
MEVNCSTCSVLFCFPLYGNSYKSCPCLPSPFLTFCYAFNPFPLGFGPHYATQTSCLPWSTSGQLCVLDVWNTTLPWFASHLTVHSFLVSLAGSFSSGSPAIGLCLGWWFPNWNLKIGLLPSLISCPGPHWFLDKFFFAHLQGHYSRWLSSSWNKVFRESTVF